MANLSEHSQLLSLPDSNAELEFIPLAGGVLNRLQLSKGNKSLSVIAGLNKLEDVVNNGGFRGVPLFPFPNRLADGIYEAHGKQYRFPLNDESNHNSLHGLLSQLSPEVELDEDRTSANLRSKYVYQGEMDYYPFPAEVEINYTLLKSSELQLRFRVRNTGTQALPLGIGWHPYFQFGELVDGLQMKMPEVKRVLINSRMLPTGDTADYEEFSDYQKLGNKNFDDCFIAQSDEGEIVTSIWSDKAECGLEIWQENQLKYLQIYIPPDRQSIAVEPVSCAINAFQSGEGLVNLEPGEYFERKFGVRLITNK